MEKDEEVRVLNANHRGGGSWRLDKNGVETYVESTVDHPDGNRARTSEEIEAASKASAEAVSKAEVKTAPAVESAAADGAGKPTAKSK